MNTTSKSVSSKSSSRKPAAKPIPDLAPPAAARSAMGDFAKQALAVPEVDITQSAEFKAALEAALKNRPVRQPKEPKAPRIALPKQHGITRPAAETKCGKIFSAADKITAESNRPATISEVRVACHGINDHTIKTQYARWRAFNGVTGRIVPETVAAE